MDAQTASPNLNTVGHEFSKWGSRVGFCVVAEVAALHIVCHIAAHPWPPEIMSDQFCCLTSARVASNWVIMVGFHCVEPQLTVMGDIYHSSM